MAKVTLRHHAVHPPTAIKPNVSVNPKPESYTPPETASMPRNPNPSVGLDVTNSRVSNLATDVCDPNVDDCEDDDEEDRLAVKHAS
jgi:hypothetical protein